MENNTSKKVNTAIAIPIIAGITRIVGSLFINSKFPAKT